MEEVTNKDRRIVIGGATIIAMLLAFLLMQGQTDVIWVGNNTTMDITFPGVSIEPTPTPTPMNMTNDTQKRSTGWQEGGGGGHHVPDAPRGVDIVVDGSEPWNTTFTTNFTSMMPGDYRTTEFDVENVGADSAKIWKRVVITNESGGEARYADIASSEPEWSECLVNGEYVERCNLSANIVYGLSSTVGTTTALIYDPNEFVMLGDINNTWVYLGQLNVGQTMIVREGYILDGELGNWAQGDVMTFDIGIYAVALDGGNP